MKLEERLHLCCTQDKGLIAISEVAEFLQQIGLTHVLQANSPPRGELSFLGRRDDLLHFVFLATLKNAAVTAQTQHSFASF